MCDCNNPIEGRKKCTYIEPKFWCLTNVNFNLYRLQVNLPIVFPRKINFKKSQNQKKSKGLK